MAMCKSLFSAVESRGAERLQDANLDATDLAG